MDPKAKPMDADTSHMVFNFQAFLVGCTTMLLCLFIQAIFVHLATGPLKRKIFSFAASGRRFAAQMVFLVSAVTLLTSHLLQIYVWGYALLLAGAEQNAHKAMVFAGSTYTTVGFANDPLPLGWQLVTIIMATSGLFSFGWSTSIMYLLSQALYPAER